MTEGAAGIEVVVGVGLVRVAVGKTCGGIGVRDGVARMITLVGDAAAEIGVRVAVFVGRGVLGVLVGVRVTTVIGVIASPLPPPAAGLPAYAGITAPKKRTASTAATTAIFEKGISYPPLASRSEL